MSDEQHQHSDTPTRSARVSRPLTSEQRTRKQAKFLSVFRETANIKESCKAAGIHRSTFYEWRNTDEAFKAQLPDASEDADDTLEYAAHDRAVNGVVSYVVSQGKLVIGPDGLPLVERKYSDTLLTVLLKARMPDKYKERVAQEHSGKIKMEHADYSKFSDEELDTLERMAQKAQHGDS